MEPTAPQKRSFDGQDVRGSEVPEHVSQSPDRQAENPFVMGIERKRQHPVGWSLQDEEHESEVEYEGEDEIDTEMNQDESENTIDDDSQVDVNSPLSQLQYWLESSHKDSLFACGGTVKIIPDCQGTSSPPVEKAPSRPSSASSQHSSSSTVPSTTPHPPITLRWDPRDFLAPAGRCKLTLPIDESTSENLEHLLADMKPATFGLGGKDVYDETYRKALKLDSSNFATNFCPYSVGIIDVVSQVLLPNPDSYKQRAIKAELYKLNMYTGPSGHFRSHVDTPRSQSQFGSLVVCLPLQHEGGALEVRHADQVMTFDWASDKGSGEPQIQWAAFYSDCEHEVFPVQSGHRITLTYNLYVTRGNGQLSSHTNALDVTQTPLYRHLEPVIGDETFMPDGGFLGFYTTHAYPHTTSRNCLTDTLKGLDMTIWQAFQRLGCGVCLRPVLAAAPFFGEPMFFNVGKKFDIKELPCIVEDRPDWEEMLEGWWGLEQISWEDLVWLNQPNLKNKQVSFAYAAYGNEPSSNLAYSVCAIIVGVPKCSDGKRVMLETTFATLTTEEESWDDRSPYDNA